MSYAEKNLIPGETVLYRTGLHWIVLLPSIVGGVCLAALGGLLGYAARSEVGATARVLNILAGIFVAAAVLAVASGTMRRNATEIAVTNKRVLIKRGIVTRHTLELLLSQVESIVIDEPLLGRMVGYGTVVIRGTGGTPEPFDNVAHPLEFRRHVQHQIEAGQYAGPRPAAAAS